MAQLMVLLVSVCGHKNPKLFILLLSYCFLNFYQFYVQGVDFY